MSFLSTVRRRPLTRTALTWGAVCALLLAPMTQADAEVPGQTETANPQQGPLDDHHGDASGPVPEVLPEGTPAEVAELVEAAASGPDAVAEVPTRRLIVTLDDGTADAEIPVIAEELGAVSVEDLGSGFVAVEVEEPLSATEAEVALDSRPDVAADVEADLPILPEMVPNDPYLGSEWGLSTSVGISPYSAWDLTNGSGVVVAVVDTGVDISHADLNPNVWTNTDEVAGNGVDDDHNGYVDDRHGWDFYSNDSVVFDSASSDAHGTHVAGTIAAYGNEGHGVVGVAYRAQIMPLKFIQGVGYTSNAVRAINYAVANGAKVINASWGGSGYSSSLLTAIQNAGNQGVLFVAAAGNNGVNTDASPYYPAAYPASNVISVAAMTNIGTRASFSNYGASSVDLAAPGQTVLSTVPGGFAYYSGTSMAAPHVSGVVALVRAFRPSWSVSQVKDAILAGVTPNSAFAGITATGGMLNASRPLRWLPPYWPGWDIASGISLSSGGDGGYTFDGYGGLHPWHDAPSVTSARPYWQGWDIVRGGSLESSGGGYTLDAWGGIHPWGGAAKPSKVPYWYGWDIARGMATDPDGPGGWTLDGWGGIHPWGGAPAPVSGPYWRGWDIARGLAVSSDGRTLYILDGFGGIHFASIS